MKFIFKIVFLFLSITALKAQEFNPNVDKDSLFSALTKDVHSERREEIIKLYKEGNSAEKEFILIMMYIPKSSKAEMINNLEKNRDKIFLARAEYEKLVPKDNTVY